MARQAAQRGADSSLIPDKLYFRIGEVAKLCKVEAYVLRFWETEFPQLKPRKGGTGQRLYRRADVEVALRIKRLLHEEGYTIPGARQAFAAESRTRGKQPELPMAEGAARGAGQPEGTGSGSSAEARLRQLRAEFQAELREVLGILSAPAGAPVTARKPRPAPAEKGPTLFGE